jgi:hypothetical protein
MEINDEPKDISSNGGATDAPSSGWGASADIAKPSEHVGSDRGSDDDSEKSGLDAGCWTPLHRRVGSSSNRVGVEALLKGKVEPTPTQ